MKKIFFNIGFLFIAAYCFADEGMWFISDADRSLQEAGKAVVSIDFMGTGSIVSREGLVITNHHVASSDIAALSTTDHNYIVNGFWARSKAEEIPIKGRKIQILQYSIDVTEQVDSLFRNGIVKKGPMSGRRLSHILEEKYSKESGLVTSLGKFWGGQKYYMAFYREYSDIRLVAAPANQIANFGGETDNWDWPQHKCDFALLRIYTAPDGTPAEYSEDNVPLKSENYLKISEKGYREGSKTIVVGYPGSTSRYLSSFQLNEKLNIRYSIYSKAIGIQDRIITKYMAADPEIRIKYSEKQFMKANMHENYSGALEYVNRFKVMEHKKATEQQMQNWFDSDEARSKRWGTLLSRMEKCYSAAEPVERYKAYVGSCIYSGSDFFKLVNAVSPLQKDSSEKKLETAKKRTLDVLSNMDVKVEEELFSSMLQIYFGNVPDSQLAPYHKELKKAFNADGEAIASALLKGSVFMSENYFEDVFGSGDFTRVFEDPVFKFYDGFKKVSIREMSLEANPADVSVLNDEYKIALYSFYEQSRRPQYADANSTLRVSYGKVGGFEPGDGVWYRHTSCTDGILQKYKPGDFEFDLTDDWRSILESAVTAVPVDFLSDNDITGGNSGSPVLNSRYELIGLAFDGNKESLCGDFEYIHDCNRTISVDIRYVLWVLRNYVHLDNILEEIGK